MFNNTHSAVLAFDGGIAFVDGIPDTCLHDGPMDEVFQSASGKTIYWHTYRQWASFTSAMRNQLIEEHHIEIEDPIVLGTCQCRKCKKVLIPQMF